jgi:hypothetical protein
MEGMEVMVPVTVTEMVIDKRIDGLSDQLTKVQPSTSKDLVAQIAYFIITGIIKILCNF